MNTMRFRADQTEFTIKLRFDRQKYQITIPRPLIRRMRMVGSVRGRFVILPREVILVVERR